MLLFTAYLQYIIKRPVQHTHTLLLQYQLLTHTRVTPYAAKQTAM